MPDNLPDKNDKNAIFDLMKETVNGIETVQRTLDEHKSKLDTLDPVDQSKIDNATNAATKAMELMQKIEQKSKAQEQSIKDLELQLAKGGRVEDQEHNVEFKKELEVYYRTGKTIDAELHDRTVDDIIDVKMPNASDYDREDVKRKMIQHKDHIAGSGPDGGYWIPVDRDNKVSQRIFETSPIRSLARVVSTSSRLFEMVLSDDEYSGGWVGEVSARPTTDTSKIGVITIPIHELYANPKATDQQLQDAGFDFGAYIENEASKILSRMENTSMVVGDGAAKPKGFLDYAAWTTAGTYERNKVEQVKSGVNASFTGDSFLDLWSAMQEDYSNNATFVMRRATFGQAMQMKTSAGAYIINPMILSASPQKTLLGSPVVFMADMPAMANDSLSVALADFNEFYTVVDRLGLRVLRDPFTAKPYIQFYTTKRVGGAVTNFQAGKIMKLAA